MSTPDSWTDATGEWLTAANWSNGLPNANSAVTIDSTNTLITVSYDPGSLSEPAIFSLQTNVNGSLDVVSGTLDVLDGDTLQLQGGLTNTGTFELSGGQLSVNSTIVNNSLLDISSNSPATATLIMTSFDPNARGSIDVGTNAIAHFTGVVPSVQSVTLTAGSAQLLLGDAVNFDAPVTGFGRGNTIDFTTEVYNSSDTIQYAPQPGGGRVTVSNSSGGEVATVLLKGSYSQGQFQIGDYGDRTLELLTTACFAAGTRIATPGGEVAIEDLREGDLVLSATGQGRPIVWIGRSRLDCRRHARPENVIPLRIRAGAFAPGLPARDLLLSPGHAVFANGVLIPAGCLVNGVSIAREPAGEVTYYHLELPAHDIVLAEGLPAESYLDDGNRLVFANACPGLRSGVAVHRLLQPDDTRRNWENACAPKRERGPEVAALKRRLRRRLAALGYRLERRRRIALLAGGVRLAPRFARRGLLHVVVPAGANEIRLVSSCAVPAGVFADSADSRRLGAQLALLLLDGAWIALDSPMLAEGFHALETDSSGSWRWTDGEGVLRLPPAATPRLLELFVRDVMPGWRGPAAEAAAAA